MRYLLIVNDDERTDNGEESALDKAAGDFGELLRSGYYEVESVEELDGPFG